VNVVLQEWLRADPDTDTHWALFLIFDDHVHVLAVLDNRLIDERMSMPAARAVWNELRQQGWHHAIDEEVGRHEMSHQKLRDVAYQRKR
jgi:hypothetical protein